MNFDAASAGSSSFSSSSVVAAALARTVSSNRIDQTKVATFSQSTALTSHTAMIRPANAGPANSMTLSRLPARALAAVRSEGESTRSGSSPAWAARNGAPTTAAATASA